MKRLTKNSRWFVPLLLTLVFFGFGTESKANLNFNRVISFDVFYSELLPYGDWVRDSRHGYVWLPAVGPDFHPYATEGHWVMTEFGNTWVSYYDWGWAPFHYGRWYYDQFYRSWAWVPGYEWGPAWVSWRTGGGYYGWAPLRPGFSINVSIGLPFSSFIFLPRANLYAYDVFRYCPPRRNRVRIYNRTTIINNTVVYNDHRYIAGPSRREVQRVTSNRVPTYRTQNNGIRGRQVVSQNGRPLARTETRMDSRSSRTPSKRGISSSSARNSRSQNEVRRSTKSRSSDVRSLSPQRGFDMKPYNGNQRNTARKSTSRSDIQRPNASSPSDNGNRNSVRTRSSRANSNVKRPSQNQRVRERNSTSSRSSSPRVNSRSSQSRSSVSKPQRTQRSSVGRSSSRSSSPKVSSSSSRSRTSSPKAKSSSRRSSKERSRTSRSSSRSSGRGN